MVWWFRRVQSLKRITAVGAAAMVAVATILVAMERVTAATADMDVGIQVTRWATALIPSIDQALVS